MSENYSDQRINAVLSITEDGGYMKHLREIVMQLRAERDEAAANEAKQWALAVDKRDKDITRLEAELSEALAQLKAIRAVVDEQALDEGLWFVAQTAPEAYLQQELRRMHAAVEC